MLAGRRHPDPSPCEAPPDAGCRRPSPWTPIMAAYVLYVAASFAIGIAGGERQFIGAMAFLAFLAVHAAPRLLPLRLTGLTLAVLAAALVPVVPLLAGTWAWGATSPAYAVKYFALLFLILIADALSLPPLGRTSSRGWGLGVVSAGLVLGGLFGGLSAERVEGSYANPNNFALASLSLLFFIDPERDPRWLQILLHAFVVGLIVLSGTTGALLAYLVGLAFFFLHARWARFLLAALTIGMLLACLWPPSQPLDTRLLGESRIVGPLWTKFEIVKDNFADLVASDPVDFWRLGQEYGGTELTSAAWRLTHWQRILQEFSAAPGLARLFGHGPGASMVLIGRLPHNDYLRGLFETGAVGLAANAAVWILLYRRAAPAVRWLAIMMATYAFTENNLDSFTVMSLFVLFFVSAGALPGGGSAPGPSAAVRNDLAPPMRATPAP